MDEKTEKTILEKMDLLATLIANEKWPRMSGIIIKESHCCGKPVVMGIWREICSACGKAHGEMVYR